MSLGEVFEVSKALSHSRYTFLLEFFTVQDVIFQFLVSGTTVPVLNYYKLQHSETETSLQQLLSSWYHSNRTLIIKCQGWANDIIAYLKLWFLEEYGKVWTLE